MRTKAPASIVDELRRPDGIIPVDIKTTGALVSHILELERQLRELQGKYLQKILDRQEGDPTDFGGTCQVSEEMWRYLHTKARE